jgi:phosphoheptose isomerase
MTSHSKWESLPTEAINPVSLGIDKTPTADIVEMILNEDRKVIAAVQKEKERIAHGIEIIAHAVRKGGRVIFIGAGTSGRLGVVEASEMPPTFGTPPNTVQAIMAGGQEAVFRAKEGVEDNYEEGARSISRLRLTQRDVVIGVSASGMTQFVRGGLTRARKAGAKIIFITCWPGSELQNFVDLQIAPAVGPELIAGSTPQSGNRHQARAQHADDGGDDQSRQDLRQPDGRRADRIREAEGSRPTDHRGRHRPRLRRVRRALEAREVERQSGDRHAEDEADTAAGASTVEESGRLRARCDRRGHRAAPSRVAQAGLTGSFAAAA